MLSPDVLPAPESPSNESALPDSTQSALEPRGIALAVLATAAAILLAQYMQSVLIPFVLAGLVFYALDPLVDRLQRLHVPRALAAGLAISLVVGGCAALTFSLMDDALEVVEQLPVAARKVRSRLETDHAPTAIEKVQEAAREIDAACGASRACCSRSR